MLTRHKENLDLELQAIMHLHLWLAGSIVVLFVWMAIAQLDVVSVAEGEVIPSTKVKYIQHLEGGIIGKILIKEADKVKNGQALFELEATSSHVDVQVKIQEIKQIKARIATLKPRLTMIGEQVNISTGLLKDQLTNRYNHLSLLREEESIKGQLQEALANLKGAESAIVKLKDNLARSIIYSPTEGVIKNINFYTVGGVVPAGGVLAEIVPMEDTLVIEARLMPQDAGYIEKGQTAQVRLMSNDAMRLGIIQGEVILISPDTLVPEQGPPYYRVRIKMEHSYFENNGQRYHLLPGMQVNASIITGKRSVLDYLTSPFRGSMEASLHER